MNNPDYQLVHLYNLFKAQTELLLRGEEPNDEWFEVISEKIYEVVHQRISVEELKDFFIHHRQDQLTETHKQIFATYFNVNTWDQIFVPSTGKTIQKSFWVLGIIMFLVFFIIYLVNLFIVTLSE